MRKTLTCILLVLITSNALYSQLCDGNLGENIFTNGSFGSGVNNNLLTNPEIAPGYAYARSGPPADGLYIITNNTGLWQGLYGTWMELQDNSDDPNGYMMVVNASFEPGLFYEQVVDGLCENTSYVFKADIINVVQRGVTGHIRPNVTFLLDDQVQYSTGDIPQDETWKTYGFVFETAPGQTTVKLTLQNNAPGGIGNDLALDNISFQACGPEALILPREVENICEDGDPINLNATVNGDQFPTPAIQWQESFDEGLTWQAIPDANALTYQHNNLNAGFYYYRYLVSNSIGNLANPKCAIISNTKIVFVQPKAYTIIDTICNGNTYFVGNSPYTTTGTFIDSLKSSIGCDSIVTLNLTVLPDQGIRVDRTISNPSCFGDSNGAIVINDITNAYLPTNTTLVNPTNNQNVPLENLTGGRYNLFVMDRYGCTFEESIQIQDPVQFTLDLGPDTTVNLGQRLNLSVNSNYPIQDFESTFSDSICQNNCLNIEWFPMESSNYLIKAISTEGCEAQDSIQVNVETVRKLFIPNAFTPNGDGNNDFFTVFGTKPLVQQVESLRVFDRWGQLVFEKTNFESSTPELGWDGKIGSEEAQEGIYIYSVNVLFLDGETANFSGDLLLLKN